MTKPIDLTSERIGELIIYRRKKRWYVNYQQSGRQHRKSLKTTSLKQARQLAIRIAAELESGHNPARRRPPLIKDVCEAYVSFLRTDGKAHKTLQKVKLVCRRVQVLAEKRRCSTILELDMRFFDAYRKERVDAEAQPKTVLNESVIIRQLVNYAISRQLIHDDPLAGLKLRKVKSREQPHWSRAEIDRILLASTGWHRIAFEVLAETGMRIGEAMWLTWDDVDMNQRVIHIRPKDGWKPKTGNRRVVPMSAALLELLASLPRSGRWVLYLPPNRQYPERNGQISDRRLLTYLKRRLARLGLEGHLHTFRHSFVSHALNSGIPETVVREWVGHVDRETLRLYTHVSGEASRAAMAKLTRANKPSSPNDAAGSCN